MQRERLMELLTAAKRGEFDVLVLTEIRALSRRQVEVFIIYDLLQKYGVRLETIQEKFEDSAMGRLILSLRAFVAEVERENMYMRLQRGKRDRIEIGKAPNGHRKPAYGYMFVDTEREAKGRYILKTAVIHRDSQGNEWTEVKVVSFIFDLAVKGYSLRKITNTLNEMGIPPPTNAIKSAPHWQASTVYRILTNRIYAGEVWVNKNGTRQGKVYKRPQEEQYLLPEGTAPAIIDKETFEAVQVQFAYNKQESLRNTKYTKDLGILRSGYVFCGVCHRRMFIVNRPGLRKNGNPQYPTYECRRTAKIDNIVCHHSTSMTQYLLDRAAWEKVIEVLQHPGLIRAKVADLREKNTPVVDVEDVHATIANIQSEFDNLFELARHASNDTTRGRLGLLMEDLEKQQREAEMMLLDLDEDEEDREKLEGEIVKFEKWVENVRPDLTNPSYAPSYEEMRLAVRILGIRATVFPSRGDWPYRYQIDITVPAIAAKMKHYVQHDSSCAFLSSASRTFTRSP